VLWKRRLGFEGVTPRAKHSVFQLRIELADVTPAVWRRVLVRSDMTLAQLHDVLQTAMGWENGHLHAFTIGGARFGPFLGDDDEPDDLIDEEEVFLRGVLEGVERFTYEYDFGDGWEHEITVEANSDTDAKLTFAVCIDGQHACPPEDCGGPHGYADLLEALADPEHEDHDEVTEWMGGAFDPYEFDLADVNAELQRRR